MKEPKRELFNQQIAHVDVSVEDTSQEKKETIIHIYGYNNDLRSEGEAYP